MSESAVEGTAGDTGAVVDQGDTATQQEDQEAQAALDAMIAEDDPDTLRAEVERWKRTAQKHERTARDNSNAAKKLQEIEDANKSELQKAVEARQTAERERDAVNMQQSRMLAATAKGLSPELIEFLGDGTSEDISARAELLSGIIEAAAEKRAEAIVAEQSNGNPPPPARGQGRRPVENLRAGAAPSSNVLLSPDQMFRQLVTGDSD